MRVFVRLVRGLALALLVVVAAAVAWLLISPPDLLRVGTGYAAKIVCSNVFIAKRDAGQVLALDVQAPGHPLLKLVEADVDPEQKRVTTRLLRIFAPSTAIYREGIGCANVPDGDVEAAQAVPAPSASTGSEDQDLPWPDGGQVAAADPRVADILADADLLGPGMRGVVVVKDGRIVGEAYGEGFGRDTPLLGWSMTKTVNAAIIGRLMLEGRIDFAESGLFDGWRADERAAITLRNMLDMESGLEFNEEYGDLADVTRMLYLAPDMAGYAGSKPLEKAPGSVFNYASGTAVLLARIWMDRFADQAEALAYPRTALFDPLGMTSAVMEADARGTFVGSSYTYATARDWARFGQFLVQDGIWRGERLLPEGFVEAMGRATTLSAGVYTEIQAWKVGPGGQPNASFGVPEDAFWLQGHDGQTITVIPSEKLVVVRLGLTPFSLAYRPEKLVRAVADALR